MKSEVHNKGKTAKAYCDSETEGSNPYMLISIMKIHRLQILHIILTVNVGFWKNTYHVVFGIKTKLKQEVLCLDNLYINLFGITQHNDSILVGFDFAVV